MRNRIFFIALSLLLTGLTTSCLENDKKNKTVYYGYQEIPNINEYMPQSLLYVLDSMHALHYGEEPPKIEGSFAATDLELVMVKKCENSPWVLVPTSRLGDQYIKLIEQHKGIAQMKFWNEKGVPEVPSMHFTETSSTDSTYVIVGDNMEHFTEDTIAPYFFKNRDYSKDVLHSVYIIGDAPYFTIFYYEIRHIFMTNFQPLNAVIISGKMDTETIIQTDTVNHKTDTIEQPVIKDYVIGIRTMKYYREGVQLSQILQYGGLPSPGDILIIKNNSAVKPGEYTE